MYVLCSLSSEFREEGSTGKGICSSFQCMLRQRLGHSKSRNSPLSKFAQPIIKIRYYLMDFMHLQKFQFYKAISNSSTKAPFSSPKTTLKDQNHHRIIALEWLKKWQLVCSENQTSPFHYQHVNWDHCSIIHMRV